MAGKFGTVLISTSTTGKEKPTLVELEEGEVRNGVYGGHFQKKVDIGGKLYLVSITIENWDEYIDLCKRTHTEPIK